jgi:predicted transcriptional regulator
MDKSTADKLEQLFDQVRTLPRERQELAAEALSEIAAADSYQLSEDELAVLEPALARAKHGEFAPDDDIEEAIGKPWA